jgi:tetratricopeptide (TPR) repeat protein
MKTLLGTLVIISVSAGLMAFTGLPWVSATVAGSLLAVALCTLLLRLRIWLLVCVIAGMAMFTSTAGIVAAVAAVFLAIILTRLLLPSAAELFHGIDLAREVMAGLKSPALADLRTRLDRLDCLASCVKRKIMKKYSGWFLLLPELTFFLQGRLRFVERVFGDVEHLGFRNLCKKMSSIATSANLLQANSGTATQAELELLRALGVWLVFPGLTSRASWLRLAMQGFKRADPFACLYALANYYALPAGHKTNLDSEAMTRTILAWALGIAERYAESVRVMEDFAGLSAPYETADIKKRLGQWTGRVDESLTAAFLGKLSQTLSGVGRHQDSVKLLEVYLNLTHNDYKADVLDERVRRRLSKVAFFHAIGVITSLGNALRSANRYEDSNHLISVAFAMVMGEGIEAERRTNLWSRLERMPPDMAADFLCMMANSLMAMDQPKDAVRLFERQLGLSGYDYDSSKLATQVEQLVGRLQANGAAGFVITLAQGLRRLDRHHETVRLLETYLSLPEGDYTSLNLCEHLAGRLDRLEGQKGALLMLQLAPSLASVDRHSDCVRLLKAFLGMMGEYDPLTLGEQLAKSLGRLGIDGAILVIARLVDGLNGLRDAEGARLLLTAFSERFNWLDGQAMPNNTVLLGVRWMRLLAQSDRDRTIDVCKRLVTHLRCIIRLPGTTSADRGSFARSLGELRQRMTEALTYWSARERDSEAAKSLRWLAVQVDVELCQRALFEQFMAGNLVIAAPDDGAMLPAPRWPYPESSQTPGRFGHGDGGGTDPPRDAIALAAFDEMDAADACKNPADLDHKLVVAPPAWLSQAEAWVGAGIDEKQMVKLLGPSTLFLRATFDTDGTLRWWMLRGDADHLVFVADNLCVPPRSLDLYRLRWASAVHDLAIECDYLLRNDAVRKAFSDQLQSRAGDVEYVLSTVRSTADLISYVDAFLDVMPGRSSPPLRDGLVNAIPHAIPNVEAWWKEAAESWRNLVGVFLRLPPETTPADRAVESDKITTRYLDEVAKVWRLEPLAVALTGAVVGGTNTEGLDLVMQVDDVLQAVPIPHLKAGGRPLFERLRSCRVSLSPLLDFVEERLEENAQQRCPNSRQMLGVSWFELGDPAAGGGVLLHELHQATANQESECEYLAAAEDPVGSGGTLLRGLTLGGYLTVTILGHGDRAQAGVYLADGLWNGQGCQLDGLEFLIIPSCSVGRVRQTGNRDVEGFCVTLTLQQARAALACRWKVNAAEAPVFADEVIRQYLRLRRESSPEVAGACLRARAVNRARRALVGNNERTGNGSVGLSTAAAFELYGRG